MSGYHSTYFMMRSIEQLKRLIVQWQLPPQDWSDAIASHMGACMFLVLSVVVSTRSYFFEPLDCLVPPQWPSAWEEASEAYCFTTSTYSVAINHTDTSKEWDTKNHLNYYYFLPFTFLLLGSILKLPDLMWTTITGYKGRLVMDLLKTCHQLMCSDLQKIKSPAAKRRMRLGAAKAGNEELTAGNVIGLMMADNGLLNFGSASLFITFAIVKFTRIAACVGTILLLQFIFDLTTPMFGPELYSNITSGHDWHDTLAFPRVVFCDVPRRIIGSQHDETIQCVLPINMLNEKMCVAIWFWLISSVALLTVFAIHWGYRMIGWSRRRYVMQLMGGDEFHEIDDDDDDFYDENGERSLDAFVNSVADVDRMFVLYLVDDELGVIITSYLLDKMHERFIKKRREKRLQFSNLLTEDV